MKILIVGLGSIARKHITALQSLSLHLEIFALRSNKGVRDEAGITNVYSIQEARNIDFDFIIISTPTFLHYQNIKELVGFKKPLFIEKPVSNNLNVEQLLPEIKQNDIKTYVGCNLRFLEALSFVKHNYINEIYRINEVNVYCGSYLPAWRPDQNFQHSYSAIEEKGGGVHLDLIHEIDYIYWLFGNPISSHCTKRSKSSLNINSIDYANYNLSYPLFSANITLNYYRLEAKRTLEIVTDKSIINVDLLKNEVYNTNKLVFKSEQKIVDTYADQMKYFLQMIKLGDNENFNDMEEAIKVLKICLS